MIFGFRRHRLSGLSQRAGETNTVFGEISTRALYCTRFSPSDPHRTCFPVTSKSKFSASKGTPLDFWWISTKIHQNSLKTQLLDFGVAGKLMWCGSLGLKRVQWTTRVESSPKTMLILPASRLSPDSRWRRNRKIIKFTIQYAWPGRPRRPPIY